MTMTLEMSGHYQCLGGNLSHELFLILLFLLNFYYVVVLIDMLSY